MNEQTGFLRKVRTVALVVTALVVIAGIGIGYGRQAWKGRTAEAKAYAAGTDTKTEQKKEKKSAVQYRSATVNHVMQSAPAGNLLQAAAHKIGKGGYMGASLMTCSVEPEEEFFEEISTWALAQEAMETLERETLQLMASPAGASWGGLIKVYAGETPLLITEEDKEVLLRIVEAEATYEDVKGRMLVANVVLNRVVSKSFPNSVTAVVFQNNGETYQFSPIKDGRYWSVDISDKTREAVERVLAGEDESQGAMFFVARKYANKKSLRWFDSTLHFLFKHGGHEFFRYK